MLSGILNSDRAINVNIQIMRIFTKLREMLTDTLSLKLDIDKIKKKLANQDRNIELVFSHLYEPIEKQEKPKPRKKIGFSPFLNVAYKQLDSRTAPEFVFDKRITNIEGKARFNKRKFVGLRKGNP